MIDYAQNIMAEGGRIAIALASGVNDNMSQSHFHDYFELYFLDAGERFHIMDDKLFKIQAGDCMIFPPRTMHRSYGEQDVSFSRVVLYFYPDQVQYPKLLEELVDTEHIYRPDKSTLHNLRRLIYAILEEQENPAGRGLHNEFMSALLNTAIVEIIRSSKLKEIQVNENRITRIIRYIHEHYAEEIQLKDLSERFFISEYYLCREFRKYTNRTVVEYLQRTRVMNAQRLFMATDMNVSQVAVETGFSSLTHFNRVFKEIAGMAPSKYRKQCRSSENVLSVK